MTARLQAASSSDHLIDLRITAERIEQGADFFSFLFDPSGIKYTPPGIWRGLLKKALGS